MDKGMCPGVSGPQGDSVEVLHERSLSPPQSAMAPLGLHWAVGGW